MHTRAALAPWILLAFAAPTAREEIAFRVAADTTLVRTLKSAYSMELSSMTIAMNGEEVPAEALGKFDIQIRHHEEYLVTDAFEAVAEGRPRRLRRTFDELNGGESSSFTSEEGDSNDSSDYASALEGRTVVFTWNEDTGRFDAVFTKGEGSDGDADLLAKLEEDMDLRRLLPPGPRSEGESWSIEPGVFACILDPGGDLALKDPEDEDADTSAEDAELRANLAGTIGATFKGTREEDGVKQAVIALQCDVRSHADQELGADEVPEGAQGTGRVEVHFVLEGELRWDLEHGHALSFELSGEDELTTVQNIAGDFDGERLEQAQTMVFSGETSFSMHVERR